jgi:hypothetical protein
VWLSYGPFALRRHSAALETYHSCFKAHPVFCGAKLVLLQTICLELSAEVYAPQEFLPPGKMYILADGAVVYAGRVVMETLLNKPIFGVEAASYSTFTARRRARVMIRSHARVFAIDACRVRELAANHDSDTDIKLKRYCAGHAFMQLCLSVLRKERDRHPGAKRVYKNIWSLNDFSEYRDESQQVEEKHEYDGIEDLKGEVGAMREGIRELHQQMASLHTCLATLTDAVAKQSPAISMSLTNRMFSA